MNWLAKVLEETTAVSLLSCNAVAADSPKSFGYFVRYFSSRLSLAQIQCMNNLTKR